MSFWTHITACLSVDTHLPEGINVRDSALVYLTEAPKITGSEGDAHIFVNLLDGYNSWTSADCERCEYRDTLVNHIRKMDGKNMGFSCDSPQGFECPEGVHQSRVVISVQGDLRDRMPEQTKQEFKAFKRYVEAEYSIRDFAVSIK